MKIDNNIRVIQLIDSLEPGGAERMAVTIANGLVDKVALSGLVVTRLEGGLKSTIYEKVLCLLDKKKSVDISALLRLRKFVKNNKVNTIHAIRNVIFFAILLKFTMPSIRVYWLIILVIEFNLEIITFYFVCFQFV